MTMREKLARAIAEGLGDDFDDAHESKAQWIQMRGEGLVSKRFRDVNEARKPDYFAAVDAILNVLRDPDEAMIEAGLETNSRFGKPAMRNIWQHMIDTIINEGRE